jgi:transposase
MSELQQIVYRLKMKSKIRAIHKELGFHRTIIRSLKKTAEELGWLDPESPLPTEEVLQATISSKKAKKSHPLEIFRNDIEQWLEKKMSCTVIHRLVLEKVSCSYTTLRNFIHKTFPKTFQPIMIRKHLIGEIADVDFGFVGLCYDPEQKRNRKAWVFSMRLRYSRKAFRTIVFDQKESTFFKCHILSFEYFEGIPEKICTDNLKAAVIKACWSSPAVLNKSYRQLAEYYSFFILPCRPYTPRQKGGVENDIKFIKRNFLPYFLEKQKQKGFDVPSIDAFNIALEAWTNSVADTRIIGGVGFSPNKLFEEEKKFLASLPEKRWDIVDWMCLTVRVDWRVRYDNVWYSVPYTLIGKEISLCAGQETIRIFSEGIEVALHKRSFKKHDYVRNPLHAPPEQENVLQCSRFGLLTQAENIGPLVLEVVEKLLSDPVHEDFRPARRTLVLEKKYGKERLQKACERAIYFQSISYFTIKSILVKELDMQNWKHEKAYQEEAFKFARTTNYFKEGVL